MDQEKVINSTKYPTVRNLLFHSDKPSKVQDKVFFKVQDPVVPHKEKIGELVNAVVGMDEKLKQLHVETLVLPSCTEEDTRMLEIIKNTLIQMGNQCVKQHTAIYEIINQIDLKLYPFLNWSTAEEVKRT